MLIDGMDREQNQFQIELALHQCYSILLMGELRAARLPVLTAPKIPNRGSIIPPFEHKYMSVPPSLLGN